MLVYSHYANFSKYYGGWLCCEWRPLDCGVVNILTVDDGYEEEQYWKYPDNWGYKVCCFDLQPQNL